MNRIANSRKNMDKWINDWSPYCMKKYQEYIKISSRCVISFNRDDRSKITHK